MNIWFSRSTEGVFEFFATVLIQTRAALAAGLLPESESQVDFDTEPTDRMRLVPCASRSMDDYAGYLTSNGLGSLDIGGARSHFDE